MTKAKTKKSPRVRLNLRIPKELLDWAKKTARKSHSTVTQIIVDRLLKMKDAQHG